MTDTVNELATAMAAAQGEFPVIEKNRTAQLKDALQGPGSGPREYKYADLANVLKGVLPILSKHKLAVLQPTFVEAGHIFVRTRLVHASGQWIECEYPVCAIHVDHQRMGSALTYAKRYALCALLGVAADDDDDGATAAKASTPEAARRARGHTSNRAPREPRPRNAPVVRPTSGGNILPPLVSKPVLSSSRRKHPSKSAAVAAPILPLNGREPSSAARHSQSDGGRDA
jgi:hypothetical protein